MVNSAMGLPHEEGIHHEDDNGKLHLRFQLLMSEEEALRRLNYGI
jgi:hypothetical protein